MTVVSGIAQWISKPDVVAINQEIVDAIHQFDFPAVMRSALDSYYDHDYNYNYKDPILGGLSNTHFYPKTHFSWPRLLLSPLSGYMQVSSMLSTAWRESLLSFITTFLALTVGFFLAFSGIRRLRNPNKSTFDLLLAAWLAPFVGGIFLWSLQLVILVPFLLLGKIFKGVQTVTAICATVPLLHATIQSALGGNRPVPGVIETVKAEREHALAEKLEKYLEEETPKSVK